MRKYTDYSERFKLYSSRQGWFDGLCFTLRETVSSIPAAIGHSIDKLLKINPLISQEKPHHMNGPFGLLFGILPWISGAVLGFALQRLLNIPMNLGYILDATLTKYTGKEFNKGMLGMQYFPFFGEKLVNTMGIYTYLTCVPPSQMSGFFGFILGCLPQLLCYGINRVGCSFTSFVQFRADWLCGPLKPQQNTTSQQKQESAPPPQQKKNRYKRAESVQQRVKEEQQATQFQAEDLEFVKKVDIFKLLGISREDYLAAKDKGRFVTRAYHQRALFTHPDKCKGDDSLFKNTKHAADILSDPSRFEAINKP